MEDFVVAFLGPPGTFCHQAAHERFGSSTSYKSCSTIRAVFEAVASRTVNFGVVPQENSFFGSVIETYDAFRDEQPGFVLDEIILPVQHCLLAPQGVKPSDIRRIQSHEQAIGQCRTFLSQYFPSASLEKVSSTAAAAEAVLKHCDSAAICSRICTVVFDGLQVLFQNIQDHQNNRTRFYVLAPDATSQLPLPRPISSKGLIRILPTDSRRIAMALATLSLPVSRIDRRPDTKSLEPFQDVYFVEVEETDVGEVVQGIQRLQSTKVEAKLLGLW
ncbi:Prephenate dehydratase domain-containing protein [Mycena indigotica]|uniref:Prephenate dehydratase domain-containing protein n=1 Tax=Mycena indigotica TaxID=2126181 RepID=A0A8H6S954_9AGAR|nr:Prephenate dehydratase domain-containing protein [Mycena indigotica]KAF7295123.1 Prephenate dehydratase domain-containing protein [Mycena indigotica]